MTQKEYSILTHRDLCIANNLARVISKRVTIDISCDNSDLFAELNYRKRMLRVRTAWHYNWRKEYHGKHKAV